MRTMKAAVVRAFGQPLTIEEVPIPTPGPGEVLVKIMASGVCHTDLHAADGDWPVKPRCRSFRVTKARASSRRVGAGRDRAEGRRPRRHRLAARCVRRLRALHHRLGDAVRGAAQQRLQRQRQLRRIRDRIGGVRRPTAGPAGLRRDGADPLRRRDDLQGHQGDRSAARRMDRDLGRRWARPHRRAVRQGDGPPRRGRRRDATRSSRSRARSAPTSPSTAARRTRSKRSSTQTGGGAHGVLVTAVSVPAFAQALGWSAARAP